MNIGDVVTTAVATTLVKAIGNLAWNDVSTKVQAWREQNAKPFWAAFTSMVNPLGLEEPREVPPKIWYPIVDHGTLEDDDFLRTKYAALLANAVDPSFEFGVRPAFVEILNSLIQSKPRSWTISTWAVT